MDWPPDTFFSRRTVTSFSTILTDGEMFATDLRMRLDDAQLLVTVPPIVEADGAVTTTDRESLSEADLEARLPLLQPIALSPGPRERA